MTCHASVPGIGPSVSAEPVELEEPRGDEGAEQRMAGLPIETPQTGCLLDRQSHARHLAVFTADSSEQVVFTARPEERDHAGVLRLLLVCFGFSRRAHSLTSSS
jgi:hypothetical protein